jgi:hypothetical protein
MLNMLKLLLVSQAIFLGLTPTAFAQTDAAKKVSEKEDPVKKTDVKKAAKKKRNVIKEPEDEAPAVEKTVIEPNVLYRMGALKPIKESVYHKEDHGDFADQLYLTLKYSKTYNYIHRVHLEPSFRTIRNNPASWEDYVIEQAFIETEIFTPLLVTAGKKTEYEGSGFIVSPSDLLNENKDIYDPVYQSEGVEFTRFKLRLSTFTLGVGLIPRRGRPSNEGKFWSQFSTDLLETDIRIQHTSHQTEKSTTGLSMQRFFGGSFEMHFDGRYQTRQRSPDTPGNAYVRSSTYTGADKENPKDDLASGYYLGGTRLIFTPRRTLVMEYISNQSGLLPDEFEVYYADLRADTDRTSNVKDPPTKLLGRHYGFVSYQDDDSIKSTHLAVNFLVNTDDQSSFVSSAVRHYITPITSIELAPTIFKGEPNTEFGEMPFAHAVYLVLRGRF